jgi:SAM-dependent methyltransferase
MYKTGEETLSIMKLAKWYNGWIFSFFEKYISGEILEVGAGIGNFSKLLAKRGKVTTVDMRKDYIKKLKKDVQGEARVGYGDIEKGKYFFKNKKFDTIVCLNVLEHIRHDGMALKNIHNLLKKGGSFILLVPAHSNLYSRFDKNLGHFRRYSKSGVIKKLEEAGFGIKKNRYFNWLGALGWFIFVKLVNANKMPSDKVVIFEKLGKIFLWPERFVDPPFGLSVYTLAYKK